MTRLDVPAPIGVCGYAYVAPDATGVAAWWRCGRDYGHAGDHATVASRGFDAYVGSHTTIRPESEGNTPPKDNTRDLAGSRVWSEASLNNSTPY